MLFYKINSFYNCINRMIYKYNWRQTVKDLSLKTAYERCFIQKNSYNFAQQPKFKIVQEPK